MEREDTPPHRAARAKALAALGRLDDAFDDVQAALAVQPSSGQYLRMQVRPGASAENVVMTSDTLPSLGCR